jgi:hypothetical protein
LCHTVHSYIVGSYHQSFRTLGINRRTNRQNNQSRKDRIINLLYNSNRSLSSSVKNNNAKHTPIQKIKNPNKSYFILNIKAFPHTCCMSNASINRTISVIKNNAMNCMINFELIFFRNNEREIFSVFDLFFIPDIRSFELDKMYRNNITTKMSSIHSFHIHIKVRILQSRHNLKVTNVCRKNCNSNQITNILHNKLIQNLIGLEHIFFRYDLILFILI